MTQWLYNLWEDLYLDMEMDRAYDNLVDSGKLEMIQLFESRLGMTHDELVAYYERGVIV